jgi:hypothetical protein
MLFIRGCLNVQIKVTAFLLIYHISIWLGNKKILIIFLYDGNHNYCDFNDEGREFAKIL